MINITLPLHDTTGLTPHVVEAMAAGATSAHNTDGTETIVLTFKDQAAADAFEKAAGLKPAKVETKAK